MTITFSKKVALGIGVCLGTGWKALAFTWTTPANPANPDDSYGSVWVVDANGKNQRKVLSEQLTDRLVAWSSDSKGFYFERRDEAEGVHSYVRALFYLPLGGQARPVLASIAPDRKNAGLVFDTFAVWPGDGTHPARIAALAVGDLSLLGEAVPPQQFSAPADAPPGSPVPAPAAPAPLMTAKVGAQTSTDDKPVVVVGADRWDAVCGTEWGRGSAWGAGVARGWGAVVCSGDNEVGGGGWIALATGKRSGLSDALTRMQPVAWSADGRYGVFANAGVAPASTILTVNLSSGNVIGSRKVGTVIVAGNAAKDFGNPVYQSGVGYGEYGERDVGLRAKRRRRWCWPIMGG